MAKSASPGCWSFGRDELAIPDRFMPHRPGQTPPPPPREGEPARSGPGPRRPPRPCARRSPPGLVTGDPLTVRLTGYLGHTLGLGAAARGYVQALRAAGVPVRTVSVPLHHLTLPADLAATYGRHGFEDLLQDGLPSFEIVAVNAAELPDFVERLGEDYFEGPRIGIWGWETNSIPPDWKRAFALVDEIWVYSRFMAENIGAVRRCQSSPCRRLSSPDRAGRAHAPRGAPGFLFLFVFDYLSTVQRKNPVGLIEAFKLAFRPGEGPQLLIKTINAPLRPLAEEELLWAMHGRPDIHVVDRSLSGEELNGLMAACDCYVSLHRAEGFGLTMAEAMAIGKPVIGTGYSGNVDFMNNENSYLVDYTLGRVGPDCEIYPAEGEWANPSIEHAVELMRRVRDEPAEAAAKGAARADIARLLSPAATGQRMRDHLERLAGLSRRRSARGLAPVTGVFLLAWVVFPALTLVLCAGAGLAVRRATGPVAVPALLVVPVGLAALVVLAGLFCYFAPLAPLAGPACALVGVMGLILGREGLRRAIRHHGRGIDLWALGAAVGAWAVLAAPVVLWASPALLGMATSSTSPISSILRPTSLTAAAASPPSRHPPTRRCSPSISAADTRAEDSGRSAPCPT